jgi:hypothetical protein
MSIRTYLHRLRRWAKPAAKPRPARPRLAIESLEDRLVPSTVTLTNHVLTYQAAAGEVNNLTISYSGTTYTLDDGSGVASTANSKDFDHIDVKLGDNNDSLTVLSSAKPINVFGEAGNDTVTVGAAGQGMEGVTATISVNGGTQDAGGKDRLILADRGAPAVAGTQLVYTVDGAAVTRERQDAFGNRLSQVQVSGTNVERLELDASNQSDIIKVNSTLAATPVEIHAGNGDDRFRVGNLDPLAGKLTLKGEGGNDVLTITDTGTTNRNYVLNTNSVKQGATTIALGTLEGLTIVPPNQDNTYTVQSMTADMPLTLNGGTKKDTIIVSDVGLTTGQVYDFQENKVVRTTGILATLTGEIFYNGSGVDALTVTAGSGGDVFFMSDTAQPALTLNGGAGTDRIDYSRFTSSVLVNMALGYATKVGALGALTNVENATGGKGDDLLVGDDNDNVLRGLAGRDALIGGKGADQLYGGEDQDLMIASDTAFDKNGGWLETIRSTWASKGKIEDRMNQLKVGVGGVQLNDTTLHLTATTDDKAVDQLFGDDDGATNASDWFWANSAQDVLTSLTGEYFK